MENKEIEIIRRINEGETALFEYFLENYSQQVFAMIVRIVECKEDAEELTQDAFMKAFNHLSSFKATSSFSTWLYRIAYNTALSSVRKKCYHVELNENWQDLSVNDDQIDLMLSDEREEQLQRLEDAINLLDAEDRAILVLFYYQDNSLKEIAHIVGQKEQNVKVRLHRIRKKLYCLVTQMSK